MEINFVSNERGQDMQKDAVALRKSLSPPGRKKTKPTPSWASVVEQQQEEEAMAGTVAASRRPRRQ